MSDSVKLSSLIILKCGIDRRVLQKAVADFAIHVTTSVASGANQEWQIPFLLVRRIQKVLAENDINLPSSEIGQLRTFVMEFCDLIRPTIQGSGQFDYYDHEEFWDRFIGHWHKPKTLEGERLLDVALRNAHNNPITLTQDLQSPRLTELASIAYHLQLLRDDEPILLPLSLLVNLLGISKERVWSLRTKLVHIGLLVKVREHIAHSKANEYRFQLDRTDLFTVP